MEDKYGEIPMFIAEGNHQAFIRYERSGWPDSEFIWIVYCPGCADMARYGGTEWQQAYDLALGHRMEEGAWIPSGELVFGPAAKWGPAL